MRLHENRELFLETIVATAQRFNLPEIYIEKDYWVTVALYHIFHSEYADVIVFKGGTSLSKCFDVIERFSEDIDLVLLQNEDESANLLKKKLRAISKSIDTLMPEFELTGVTNKKGMIRKTAHSFTQIFDGVFGEVKEHIILEST